MRQLNSRSRTKEVVNKNDGANGQKFLEGAAAYLYVTAAEKKFTADEEAAAFCFNGNGESSFKVEEEDKVEREGTRKERRR